MSELDLGAWGGRLHPLVLHLPIVLVLAAAVLAVGPGRRSPGARSAARLATIVAVPAAWLAAGSGWLLAAGERPSDALELHRWLGVAAAALVSGAWLVGRRREGALRAGLLLAAAATTVAASHVGATLVWGARWLWPPPARASALAEDDDADAAEEPADDAAPEAAATSDGSARERVLERGLVAAVQALLARRCVECHGPTRSKGDLRLDDLEALLARERARGPAELALVRAGRPDESELLRLVELPPDDLDVMPAEGEPLAPEELALLRAWIEAGAPTR